MLVDGDTDDVGLEDSEGDAEILAEEVAVTLLLLDAVHVGDVVPLAETDEDTDSEAELDNDLLDVNDMLTVADADAEVL
jgi:hypothetical protein